MTPEQIARLVDHTLLRPEASRKEIEAHTRYALIHPFATVCVFPMWVPFCVSILRGAGGKVGTVVDFPFGSSPVPIKTRQAGKACEDGAAELDMVLNLGLFKSGDDQAVEDEIAAVVRTAGPRVPVKVILETCYLTREEKIRACRICESAGAAFVKTSTGMGPAGATEEDVRLMRATVGDRLGVKASGGIRDLAAFTRMVVAGASRIGTSNALSILKEAEQNRCD